MNIGLPGAERRESEASRYDAVVAAPFGALGICVGPGGVERIALLPGVTTTVVPTSGFAEQVAAALQGYFRDARQSLAVPLRPRGTVFQQRVWRALQYIPSGETCSYGELARRLNSSARAVGGACGANPIAVLIPCHRVVAARGLGGFAGETEGEWLAVKRWLLRHEGAPDVER